MSYVVYECEKCSLQCKMAGEPPMVKFPGCKPHAAPIGTLVMGPRTVCACGHTSARLVEVGA